jgi:hypothetical protein
VAAEKGTAVVAAAGDTVPAAVADEVVDGPAACSREQP